jgi:hypothetical protein
MVASRATSYRMDPRAKARLELKQPPRGSPSERCWNASWWRAWKRCSTQASSTAMGRRDGGRRWRWNPIWEIISALRYTGGSDAERVAALAEQFDLHPRHICTAIDFATAYREVIDAQVTANGAAAERTREVVEQHARLMAS